MCRFRHGLHELGEGEIRKRICRLMVSWDELRFEDNGRIQSIWR
jgi:hypothetical protein